MLRMFSRHHTVEIYFFACWEFPSCKVIIRVCDFSDLFLNVIRKCERIERNNFGLIAPVLADELFYFLFHIRIQCFRCDYFPQSFLCPRKYFFLESKQECHQHRHGNLLAFKNRFVLFRSLFLWK